MWFSERHYAVLVLTVLLPCSCTKPPSASPRIVVRNPSTSSTPAPVERASEAREIEELIEKLAISQEPAADEPVYTPSIDTDGDDPRVVAYHAADRLTEYGKSAFPQLLAHLNDKRQSVAFRRMIPHDVGLACFCIIEDQVMPLPADYRGSFYRTGADGQSHARPRFLAPGVFTANTVNEWLAKRHEKSLREMQLEALDWLIAAETEIGFQTAADRDAVLGPLERQRAKVATGDSAIQAP